MLLTISFRSFVSHILHTLVEVLPLAKFCRTTGPKFLHITFVKIKTVLYFSAITTACILNPTVQHYRKCNMNSHRRHFLLALMLN